MTGDEGRRRGRVESGHARALETVFGTVRVERLAYRASGVGNLHPADAALNLPIERHSHGLRKLAALESPRGSFAGAGDAIERQTGVRLGKRQVEELAGLAAVDFEDFYEQRRAPQAKDGDLLVLSADGKGIVMRPDALRIQTATRRARAGPKPKARLAGSEKLNCKRMAEIGAVYDATPAPRTAADILARDDSQQPAGGPVAANKWLTASIVKNTGTVIKHVFQEADRRDPKHRRTWVALVDGNNHQIQRIKAEAKARDVKVTIVVDFIHVLEYLWTAAGCLYPDLNNANGCTSKRPRCSKDTPRRSPARSAAPRPTVWTSSAETRRRRRQLPDQQGPVPRLPDRARQRLADRDRDHRRRLPPPRQRPNGHHRRPLGTRRRRSHPEATRAANQR